MNEETVAHTYKGILFSIKKTRILQYVALLMNAEDVTASLISQSQVLNDTTYMRQKLEWWLPEAGCRGKLEVTKQWA